MRLYCANRNFPDNGNWWEAKSKAVCYALWPDFLLSMDLLPPTPIVPFYNIFPPPPPRSTMEKALRMDGDGWRRDTGRSLPCVSDSHFALQITIQCGSRNKLESHNWALLLSEGQDEEIWRVGR